MDAGRQTTVKRQIDDGREVMTKAQFALQCKQYIFQYVVTPKIFFFAIYIAVIFVTITVQSCKSLNLRAITPKQILYNYQGRYILSSLSLFINLAPTVFTIANIVWK